MRIRWTSTLVCACAIAALGAAQDVHPILSKARVIEEGEHDAATAAELYAGVMNDEQAPGAVRTDAALRLAGALRSLGRAEEARAMLERAAAGEGPAVAAAKARLAAWPDPQKGEGSIDLEVLRLMTQLREGDPVTSSASLAQLAWYGERAVPLLVEAVRTETDFAFVTNCARALFGIGGANVDRWIDAAVRMEEALRRRAIARAGDSASERQKERLAAFLGDPSPDVRMQAVESGVLVDWAQAAAMVGDEDGRVRDRVVGWLSRNPILLPAPDRVEETLAILIDATPHGPSSARYLNRVIDAIGRVEDPAIELALGLRALRVVDDQESLGRLSNWSGGLNASALPTNCLADEVLELARSLPNASFDLEPPRNAVLQRICRLVVPFWNRERLDAALELLERGYGFDVDWFGRCATADDWTRIFRKLFVFEAVPGFSAGYLTRQLQASADLELPDAAFEPLRTWFMAKLADPGATRLEWLEPALQRLGRFRSAASLQWTYEMLVGGIAASPVLGNASWARDALLIGLISGEPERCIPTLRRLAVVEGEQHADLRNLALGRLVWLHDVESAGRFATAYRLGLDRSELPMTPRERQRSPNRPTGIGLQFLARPLPKPWTDAERALAVEPCLEAGLAAAFRDLEIGDSRSPIRDPKSPEFAAAMRWIPRCSDAQMRWTLFQHWFRLPGDEAVGQQIVTAGLGDDLQVIRLGALKRIADRGQPIRWSAELEAQVEARLHDDDPRVVAEAIAALAERSAKPVESWVAGFVDAEDSTVRSTAIRVLFTQAPDRAFELTAGAWRSPENRSLMCSVAQQSLDRRFVPFLIDALRDPSEATRASAKAALDAIEFFVSQEQRWQRLLDDAGLESTNAAEALLTQARTATELPIRIAAIQSLGTLAVPETLPFLIQMMQDAEPEVAAAAGAAVERINQPKRD